ncbi:MAG TPA: hypothetical protein VK348_11130 [Planctomycetota bacterium]|nr:hypothetical protein [Planctomycetota bacterium]
MNTVWFACRATLRRLLVVVPLLLLSANAGRSLSGGDANDTAAAAGPWLHVVLFVTALVACLGAVDDWPAFATGQDGADWVLRIAPGVLRGCGAATAGTLAALLLATTAIALAAPLLLPRLPAPRAFLPLVCSSGQPLLAGARTTVQFRLDREVEVAELHLHPAAFMPGDQPVPTALEVLADGQPLGERVEVSGNDAEHILVFAPRRLQLIELRRSGGNVPLAFPPGAVVAVAANARSTALNLMFGCAVWLLPAFLALATAMLLAPSTSLPVNLAVTVTMLLVTTLGELTPTTDAITACLRGHWLPGEPVFHSAIPSLAGGVLVMILAMLVRRRSRR